MKLYLVQHGEAYSESEDPERSLTEQGAAAVETVAAWAGLQGLGITEIRHSRKRRAEQTASILGLHLDPPGGVLAVDGLKPKDDVEPLADELAGRSDPLLLVGHLPFLDRLASRLVAGDADAGVVRFRNGAVVCLGRGDDGWRVEWVASEDLVR